MINKVLASFQGNIAAGKTTFVKMVYERMKNDPDFRKLNYEADFIEEPVKEWQSIKNEKGEGLLKVFYYDMERWAYTFQNAAYITRMSKVVEKILKSKKQYIFTDRSLQCDRNVFAKMLYNDGIMNLLEWNTYNHWNDFFDSTFYGGVHHVIYLRCDPEVAYKRMKQRKRDPEKKIPLAYLEAVHKYHDEWLLNNVNKDKYNVLVMDCDEDFEYHPNIFEIMYNKFKKFILLIEPYNFVLYLLTDKNK